MKITHFSDLDRWINSDSKPLIFFSGGLDGAYLIAKLIHEKRIKSVLALTIELGGEGDSQNAEKIARVLGADSLVIDQRQFFAENYVLPSLQAHAMYLDQHPISASLSRPCIVKLGLQIAKEKGCDIILYCATNSQNSLRRFSGAMSGLGYNGIYGSPYVFSDISRAEKSDYLQRFKIPAFLNREFSIDSNFWCREFESGGLDNIENLQLPEHLFLWTKINSAVAPIMTISLTFHQGRPVSINGKDADFLSIVNDLNFVVGQYKIGRYTGLEEIERGVKFPELREMPAAALLFKSFRYLESACLSAETIRNKLLIEQLWVREAVEGRWYFPLREAAQAFIKEIVKNVSGTVTLELSPGNIQILGMTAANAFYGRNRDEYEKQLLKHHQDLYSSIGERVLC